MRTSRIFVDANVIFSAAYKEDARVGRLWTIESIHLLTSLYAMEEAQRNLLRLRPHRISTLQSLAGMMEIIPVEQPINLQDTHGLPEKDLPILQAAIHCKADYLLTGDFKHFNHLLGREVKRVKIMTPAQFFADISSSSP